MVSPLTPFWNDFKKVARGSEQQDFLSMQKSIPQGDEVLWVSSSGSSQSINQTKKWIALSQHSLEEAAYAQLKALKVNEGQRWGLLIPENHIGGLSLRARCLISKGTLLRRQSDWSAEKSYHWLEEQKIQHISVVPTQLYDWIQRKLTCPLGIKTVLVGGAQLSLALWREAHRLGWPVIASYGMTETSAMVAMQDDPQGSFIPLEHAEIKMKSVEESSRIAIKSGSLMLGYWQKTLGQEDQQWFPLLRDQDGFWVTEDVGTIEGRGFRVIGKSDYDFVKIKGTGVNLNELNSLWSEQYDLANESLIEVRESERNGKELVLVVSAHSQRNFQDELLKWCKSQPRAHHLVETIRMEIPRSDLGKPLRRQVRVHLNKSLKISTNGEES